MGNWAFWRSSEEWNSLRKKKREKLLRKENKEKTIIIREKGGHNSEPTQKQNCYCESMKELMKNKRHTYSDYLQIN